VIGVPPQAPLAQVSSIVQPFPSSQAAVLFVKAQPDAGSQLSFVHGLLSLHTIGV